MDSVRGATIPGMLSINVYLPQLGHQGKDQRKDSTQFHFKKLMMSSTGLLRVILVRSVTDSADRQEVPPYRTTSQAATYS